jgi:hypothetical protein
VDRIRQRLKKGTSALKSAEFWMKKTLDRYRHKGPKYVAAFEARSDKTREALLDKLSI